MNLMNVINGTETTIKAKDLTIFLHTEEIAADYREDVLNLETNLEILRHEFKNPKDNSSWTLISTPNDNEYGLFVYSESHNLLFVNHHFISSLLLDEVAKKLGAKGFFLFGGLYNNSKVNEVDGIRIIQSNDLAHFAYREIYGEVVKTYNEANKEALLNKAKGSFDKLNEHEQNRTIQSANERAVFCFINDIQPTPVSFRLDYERYFHTDRLTFSAVSEVVEALSQKEEHAQRLASNPVVDDFGLEFQYERYLTIKHYEENIEKWNQDTELLAARQIAKLKRTGVLRSVGKTAIDCLEFEIVLKGKRKKQKAFCKSPLAQSTYFQPYQNAMFDERIYYHEISKIYVDGCEVFCFKAFQEMLEAKAELDSVRENKSTVDNSKSSITPKKANPIEIVLVEAKENISQKAKLVKGQMALNLF